MKKQAELLETLRQKRIQNRYFFQCLRAVGSFSATYAIEPPAKAVIRNFRAFLQDTFLYFIFKKKIKIFPKCIAKDLCGS